MGFVVLVTNLFGLTVPILTGYVVSATGGYATALLVAGAFQVFGVARRHRGRRRAACVRSRRRVGGGLAMRLNRRDLLALSPALAFGPARAASPPRRTPLAAMPNLAYVGCRTTRARGARGLGLSVFEVRADGGWTQVQLVEGLVNPSFLALDRTGACLYAVHGDMTNVTSFRREADGKLVLLGRTGTGGANPVHLAPDPTNRFMLVANYATGSVAALPRRPDGALAPPAALLDLPGRPGPDPVQQRGSHPHQVAWDPAGRFAVVPDKGTDQIFVLRFDPLGPGFEIAGRFATRPGAGPRHIAFHPTRPYAFVAYELSAEVGVYRYDPPTGALDLRAVHPTVPSDAAPGATAAEVLATAGGDAVLVTNRGHDSLYSARFVPEREALDAPSWTPCGGRGPRFATFGVRPDRLLVANELSDDICAFNLDAAGRPVRAPQPAVATGSPVCIVMNRR